MKPLVALGFLLVFLVWLFGGLGLLAYGLYRLLKGSVIWRWIVAAAVVVIAVAVMLTARRINPVNHANEVVHTSPNGAIIFRGPRGLLVESELRPPNVIAYDFYRHKTLYDELGFGDYEDVFPQPKGMAYVMTIMAMPASGNPSYPYHHEIETMAVRCSDKPYSECDFGVSNSLALDNKYLEIRWLPGKVMRHEVVYTIDSGKYFVFIRGHRPYDLIHRIVDTLEIDNDKVPKARFSLTPFWLRPS